MTLSPQTAPLTDNAQVVVRLAIGRVVRNGQLETLGTEIVDAERW